MDQAEESVQEMKIAEGGIPCKNKKQTQIKNTVLKMNNAFDELSGRLHRLKRESLN